MSWHPPDPDRITLARLDGTAGRHVVDQTPEPDAAAELREIATQIPEKHGKPVVRVDLLSRAAGTMLGRWQADPVVGWIGERGAQLLIAAGGTDQEIGRAAAAEARERMGGPGRYSS